MSGVLETAQMLRSLLGIDEDEATAKLDRTILVTVPASGDAWAVEIESIVGRTVSVTRDPDAKFDLELVVSEAEAVSDARKIFADIGAHRVIAGSERPPAQAGNPSCLFEAAAAAVVAAVVVRAAIDDARLPTSPDPLNLHVKEFGIPDIPEGKIISLEDVFLVGAGAVAHGFLRALRRVPVHGELDIVDPKAVSAGNLNRCLYLRPGDEGSGKAELLARRAAPDFPSLKLNAVCAEFAEVAKGRGRISTMIVTVDSRIARRKLQKFLPGRVLDASTTDVREVVIHSNRQPAQGACLACLYRHIPDEHAREASIADGLGLDVATVQRGFVTSESAERIALKYKDFPAESLVGRAFDTLFRELCATQALQSTEGRQVFTPFAFVSALAGALLAIELVRQHAGYPDTGGWHVDPWRGPVGRTRGFAAKNPECEVCADPHFATAIETLWGAPESRRGGTSSERQ